MHSRNTIWNTAFPESKCMQPHTNYSPKSQWFRGILSVVSAEFELAATVLSTSDIRFFTSPLASTQCSSASFFHSLPLSVTAEAELPA